MAGNTPTPPPPPAKPPAPIPVPVAISKKNTIDGAGVVMMHMWQEYHWKAGTDTYLGETDEDKRVAEVIKDGARVYKESINVSFCETAMACLALEPPPKEELFLHWWLEDLDGNIVAEHPRFNKAHFDAKDAKAKVSKAQYAWRWDGRRTFTEDPKNRIFLRKEVCYSRISLRSKERADIPLGVSSKAHILVQGDPYKVWLVGEPKADAELLEEFNLRKQWIDKQGDRFQADCWIKVSRGVDDSDPHLVFLGEGAMEATEVENDRFGAIATPHDVDHKAYIRQGTHGKVQFWLCELIDQTPQRVLNTNNADVGPWLITLKPEPGLPLAGNPFCDAVPGKAFKDGVHTHHSFSDGTPGFLFHGASVGCTTVVPHPKGTRESPASVIPALQSNIALFGQWNGDKPGAAPHEIWGPPVRAGHKDTFFNKQTKRSDPADVAIADTFAAPMLKPPAPAGATGVDEPLHMQPTAQNAVFGGFLGHEVPVKGTTPKEPEELLTQETQVRIRIRLKQAPEQSRYWQYHRLAVLGHTAVVAGASAAFDLSIPRMVQRLWNGHWRNLPLWSNSGKAFADYAWFFEHRGQGEPTNAGWIGSKPPAQETFHALDHLGPVHIKGVKLPPLAANAYGSGERLYSVFSYRIKLQPAVKKDVSHWAPLAACTDLFTSAGTHARLTGEAVVQVGSEWYLFGRSELLLPPAMPTPEKKS